jgi:large subunit ribosomal protein L9
MKVVFLKPQASYTVGQVANVADGFAKNFLIPHNIAVPATTQAVEEARQRKNNQAAAVENAEHNLEALIQAISGAMVHVESKAATSGTLYAAVTPAHIAKAIAKQTGFELTPTLQKQLPTLKHAGKHQIKLHIHATTVTFTIDI